MYLKLLRSLLLSLILLSSAWAGPVGRRAAMEIAAQFVQVDRAAELRQLRGQTLDSHEPAYHIFNDVRRSGFVIVSGEDALPPILGYADRGQVLINEMPEQLSYLLRQYTRLVEQIRRSGGSIGQPNPMPKRYPKIIKSPMIKSQWDQSTPFNDLVPQGKGTKRPPTGCVATAMAQIMYHYRWPAQGKGLQTYQPPYKAPGDADYYYPELTVNFANSRYDWSNMIPRYERTMVYTDHGWQESKKWTPQQGQAVAKLMYDAGVSVKMMYTPDQGSGAYTSSAAEALKDNFDYHVYHIDRSEDNALFLSALQKELDANNPLLLSGGGSGGGHAWVIDGYDENGFLHANWGWGGVSDGYFDLSLMNPPALGIGGGTGGFVQGQEIVLARPRRKDVEPFSPPSPIIYVNEGSQGVAPMPSTQTDLTTKRQGWLELGYFSSSSKSDHHVEIGLGLYNDQGKLIQISSAGDDGMTLASGYGYKTHAALDLTTPPADGNYTMRLIWRPHPAPASESWQEARNTNQLSLEIKNGLGKIGQSILPSSSFALLKSPGRTSVWLGHQGSVSLKIENQGSTTRRGDLVMIVSPKAGGGSPQLIEIGAIAIYGGQIYEQTLAFDTKGLGWLTPGLYTAQFGLKRGSTTDLSQILRIDNPFEPLELEVKAVGSHALLELSRHHQDFGLYEADGQPYKKDLIDLDDLATKGKQLYVGGSVRNVGSEPFEGVLEYYLQDPDTGVKYLLGKSATVKIPASQEPNQAAPIAQTRAQIKADQLAGLAGKRLIIKVLTQIADNKVDIWNPLIPQHYLSISSSSTPAPSKYTITLEPIVGSGQINLLDDKQQPITPGTTQILAGTIVKITPKPEAHYKLGKLEYQREGQTTWQDITEAKQVKVESNIKIKATFTLETYAVTIAPTEHGQVSIKGKTPEQLSAIPYGTELAVEVTPDTGYRLAKLMAGKEDITDKKTFTLKEPTTITVTFVKQTYAVTIAPTEHGRVSIKGKTPEQLSAIPYGTELAVEVTPDTGYRLAKLMAGEEDITDKKTFTLKEPTTITATFVKQTYAVTHYQPVHGTIRIKGYDNLKAVPYGTELAVEATPEAGYELESLTVNGESIMPAGKFRVFEACYVVATFRKKSFHAVTFYQPEHGFIKVTGYHDLKAVPHGKELTVEVAPEAGYELESLTANGRNIMATRKFVVDQDIYIVATFRKEAPRNYVITIAQLEHGRIRIKGHDNLLSVPHGYKLTVEIETDEGYEVEQILAGDKDITVERSFIVTGHTIVTAKLRLKTYKVTYTNPKDGVIHIKGADNLEAVPHGTKLTVLLSIEGGRELVRLMANDLDITHDKSFVVVQDTKVTATLRLKNFRVTFDPPQHGLIKIVGYHDLSAVPYNTELSVLTEPEEGYELKSLTANGWDIMDTHKFVVLGSTHVIAIFTKSVGIGDVQSSGHLKVYPSPATRLIVIGGVPRGELVRIISLSGKVVLQTQLEEHGQVEVGHLDRGIYIVEIAGQRQRIALR